MRVSAHEVLLDVVVRDSKGRFVRDLKPDEVEVYDEGVQQKLTGFRLVTGKEQMGLTGEQGRLLAERLPLDPTREVRRPARAAPAGAGRGADLLRSGVCVSRFREEPDRKRYRGHISFLLVVKDAAGEIVRRFSRDLGFYAPSDDIEAYRKRDFAGTFHLDLKPGRYTVKATVLDRESMRASAQRSTVTVAAPGDGIAAGDITFVRQTGMEMNPADPEDPFYLDGNRIIPRLNPVFRRAADPALTFYVVLATSPAAGKPQADVEVIKDGTVLTKSAMALPAPDHRGLIRYVASLPLGALGIGDYEIRITATQGRLAAEARAAFVIQP